MKNKETLEEATNNAWDNYEHIEGNLYSTSFKNGFELGAKWQQKQAKKMEKQQIKNAFNKGARYGWESKDSINNLEEMKHKISLVSLEELLK